MLETLHEVHKTHSCVTHCYDRPRGIKTWQPLLQRVRWDRYGVMKQIQRTYPM